MYIYIYIHKLNLDQSFLELPNFDPGGYDTIYEIFRKNFGETSAVSGTSRDTSSRSQGVDPWRSPIAGEFIIWVCLIMLGIFPMK